MRVGIIGAGRVGCSLAFALAGRGIEITGIIGRSREWVSFAESRLGRAFSNDTGSLIENADLIFITTPDGVIETSAGQISRLTGHSLKDKIFLHCSGALTSAVLSSLKDRGAYTGSLHPIQTFPDRKNSWKGMYGIFFGFEGMKEAEAGAAGVVDILDGHMVVIRPESKPLYHAAACSVSNYLSVISKLAEDLLEAANIDISTGMEAFRPLFLKTVENIISSGSKAALTGPVERGDVKTIAGHMAAMQVMSPKSTDLYGTLGTAAVKLALEKGSIDRDRAAELSDVLNSER